MMANCEESSLPCAKLHSAGISFRLVRSPLAPKITITQGLACCPCSCMSSVIWLDLILHSILLPSTRGLLHVSAKLEAHRGQELVCKIVFSARYEALEERRSEDWRGSRGFDSGKDRPTAFARIRYSARKLFERRL